MKYVIVLAIILWTTAAGAAPWLICDPPPVGETRTSYKFSGDSFFTTKAAEANGSLRYDVAGISVGTHNIQVQACKTDPLWGEVCSTATPFTFTRPNLAVSVPSGLGLVP